MKCKETVFGFPTWYGNIKARYIKGHHCRTIIRPNSYAVRLFNNSLKVGDVVNDCSGFNKIVQEINPFYGYRFDVLTDIDLTMTDGSGCSFRHCGVSPAQTRETIEAHLYPFHKHTVWGNPDLAAILEAGGHICDENGFRLPLEQLK